MSIVEPSAPAPAAGDAPAPPPRTGVLRGTALVATLAVAVALAGVGMLLLPIATPAVDCGTAYSYLYDGRFDQVLDPAAPPEGVTRAEAEANNAEPCHDLVVAKARPGGLMTFGGTFVALVVVVVEGVVRLGAWWRRRPPRAAPTAP